jgi:hypothetical protein
LAALAVLTGAGPMPAHAAALEHISVQRDESRYRMELSARLDAPLDRSFAVFSDYRQLPKINDAVERIELRDGATPPAQRLYTRVRVCVWLFCTHLDQVQDIVRVDAAGTRGLHADVLPQQSNLRYGSADWRMHDCRGDTCLEFAAELEPDFWVPPLIGPWAIERAMRREAVQTAQGIERMAQQDTKP